MFGGDGVVCLPTLDDVAGFASVQMRNHPTGGPSRVDLDPGGIHVPSCHPLQNLPPGAIAANSRHQTRIGLETPEVPGHVEGSTAQNSTPVGKMVEQGFAEDERAKTTFRRA